MNRTFASFMVLTVLAVAATSVAQAQGKPCSNSTLKGTYGALISGTVSGLPFAALNTVTSNGQGSFSGTGTIAYNGAISQGVPLSATYSVNSDCSGSVAFSSGVTQNLVISVDGNEVQFIRTDDPNSQVTGDAKRVRGNCSDRALKGQYGARLDGFSSGLPFAALDQVAADGNGNVTGGGTISYNGAISTTTFTATYSVNSDCSGAIAFSTGATQDLVVVGNGAEVRFIRTDNPNAVVTGIAKNLAASVF